MAGRYQGPKLKHDLPGLKVEHSSNITEELSEGISPGWYICVKKPMGLKIKSKGKNKGVVQELDYTWEALATVPFVRQTDALMASHALIKAKLDSKKRMKDCGAEEVLRVIFESLQW